MVVDQPGQGALMLIKQRLHENDLVGELLCPELKLALSRWSSENGRATRRAQDYIMFTASLRGLLSMPAAPNGRARVLSERVRRAGCGRGVSVRARRATSTSRIQLWLAYK